ncbi:MAG: amidohydrolase [Candidatus Zixiibacteriota bacterium]
MKTTLLINGRIHTQADGLVVNSLAIHKNRVVAIGNNLEHDIDFRSYARLDLGGKCVTPGFVDAHAHFLFFALTFGHIRLEGLLSLSDYLKEIKFQARRLPRDAWVVGEGYSPDQLNSPGQSPKEILDSITCGRPAILLSKDQHSAWVNSKALEIAGICRNTVDPKGGRIDRTDNGEPSGLLFEMATYKSVLDRVKPPSSRQIHRLYGQALKWAYRHGVTGIHSFDGPEALDYFRERAQNGRLGIRINHYPRAEMMSRLKEERVYYGSGDEFLRIAGIKIFSDGSLVSQTALCFHKYAGSNENYGIEVNSTRGMIKVIREAAKLGFPCAIHAIGDRAVCNVLDAFEQAPRLFFGARHRIEHLQLIRRKDISCLKRQGIVCSMQPSHCPSDVPLIDKYWGRQGKNAFIFRTLIDSGIELAFGSDAPIEPLNPLAGVAAAVRRAPQGKRKLFYPEQRISVAEALHCFTVGPAIASGQEHCRGKLLPGYPADFVVLSDDLTRIPASKLYDVEVLATALDGRWVYTQDAFSV